MAEPPEETSYQDTVFAELALSCTVPAPQRDPGVVTGSAGLGRIVAVAETLVLLQDPLFASA
jgi:hypothetical protein